MNSLFNYIRVFSVLGVMTVVVVALLVGVYIRDMAFDEIVSMTKTQDASLSQGYVATVWEKYHETLDRLAIEPHAMQNDSNVQAFAQETVGYFHHVKIARVNVYNGAGQLLITVNSAANKIQLANNAASPDIGAVAKQIKWASAGTKLIPSVELHDGSYMVALQSVIPIKSARDRQTPDGALEIVHDVTAGWTKVSNLQIYGTAGIIATFIMFMVVWINTTNRAQAIISKQYDLNFELTTAVAAAQAENRDKSQFLANVSHELRTPLNAIIGFSEIIRNEVITLLPEKKYHDYINDIHSSGVHLLSLINDILEYSKAEAGKLELEVSEINASKMIQNCIRLLGPRAESAQVKLVEKLPRDAIIMITDGKKFKQIFLNLLSNAVKFTQANGEISVSAWRNTNEDTFGFEVKDTGIGIAPKDISRAMAPFGQVDNKLSRKYEGTGLGLPLTKKFVEMMGGKFSIESEVNVGTKVTFVLPRILTEHEGIVIKQLS